jgi:hypothetical protein
MERYVYNGLILDLEKNQIFVFGSNPEGRHGKGAAKVAMDKFGARYGQGRGLSGKSYGLITKNLKSGFCEKLTNGDHITYNKSGMRSISKEMMIVNIKELYHTARKMKETQFFVAYTKNGRLLNGYSIQEMASFFREASKRIPRNIVFEKGFYELVKE